MKPLATEYFVVTTGGGNYIVTEETALSIVSQLRAGVHLIECELIDGSRYWFNRREFIDLLESTMESREYFLLHNRANTKEKRDAGFFEDDNDA